MDSGATANPLTILQALEMFTEFSKYGQYYSYTGKAKTAADGHVYTIKKCEGSAPKDNNTFVAMLLIWIATRYVAAAATDIEINPQTLQNNQLDMMHAKMSCE